MLAQFNSESVNGIMFKRIIAAYDACPGLLMKSVYEKICFAYWGTQFT